MSNDNESYVYERFAKLLMIVGKLIMDGKREIDVIIDILQRILIDPNFSIESEESRAKELPQKFDLVSNLGTFEVPDDYDGKTWLNSFCSRNRQNFGGYNTNITDKDFPKTSDLRSGEKFWVGVFKPINSVPYEECLTFLENMGASLLGPQEITLAYESFGSFSIPVMFDLIDLNIASFSDKGTELCFPYVETSLFPEGKKDSLRLEHASKDNMTFLSGRNFTFLCFIQLGRI